MLKSLSGIAGALLLATTSFAPGNADAQAPQKDGASIKFTVKTAINLTVTQEGRPDIKFELSDCDVRLAAAQGSRLTFKGRDLIVRGDATVSALKEGKQVFFMQVKDAVTTATR